MKTMVRDSTWTKKIPRGKNHNKTTTKTTVSLYLSKQTIKRARNHNLNLSKISEQALNNILRQIEPQNNQNYRFLGEHSFGKEGSVEPRAGFEPATSALPRQCPTS